MVFDEILAITQGGPGNDTWVAAWYTYRMSFQPPFNIGLGAASAWVLTLIIGAFALALRALRLPAGGVAEPASRRGPRRVGALAREPRGDRVPGRAAGCPSSSSSVQSEKTLQGDIAGAPAARVHRGQLPADPLRRRRSAGPIFEQVSYLPKSVERFPAAFLNSLIVGVAVTLIALALASLSAYTIARLKVRWTQALLQMSAMSRMVPLIVLMVPLYVLFRTLRAAELAQRRDPRRGRLPDPLRHHDPGAVLRVASPGSWRTPPASTAARASPRSSG